MCSLMPVAYRTSIKHTTMIDTKCHSSVATTVNIPSSPINKVATEILHLIFLSAYDSFQREDYKTPLSISLVCSKWRGIALSLRDLWSCMSVDQTSGDIFRHYIHRSGQDVSLSVKTAIDMPLETYPLKEECDAPRRMKGAWSSCGSSSTQLIDGDQSNFAPT